MKPVLFNGHTRPIKDIQFNLEDDLLFTASVDRFIMLWSSETTERIGTYFHDAAINCMVVTPDSKYLVSGDNSGCIYLWDVCTGACLGIINSENSSPVTSLHLGVSDRQICATFPSRLKKDRSTVMVFDIEEVLRSKAKQVHSDDSTNLKEGSQINHYQMNSIPHSKIVSDTDHKIMISRFLNCNKNLLCAYDNGQVALWDIAKGSVLKSTTLHSGEKSDIMDLYVTGKEELALSSGKDKKSVLFDPETLEVLNEFKPENPLRNINSGKISPLFNPDLPEKDQLRHVIIGGGQDSKDVTKTKEKEGGFEILFYDMILGTEIGSITGHFSPINALAVSNNGKIIVSGGEEANVRMHTLPPEYYNLKDY